MTSGLQLLGALLVMIVYVWIIAMAAVAALATVLCGVEIRRRFRARHNERRAHRLIAPRASDPDTAIQEFTAGPVDWALSIADFDFLSDAGVREIA